MSIPAATDPCRQRLAQGALEKLQTKHLGTQLMTKRILLSAEGSHLSDLDKAVPKVYDGRTGHKYDDRAMVAYVSLPKGKLASLEILNPFEPGTGDVLRFKQTSLDIVDCEVNRRSVNFAEYVIEHGLAEGLLPLVGDFAGAHVNVSLQAVDKAGGKVKLYAPVFPGVDYRFAKPVRN